MEKITNNGEKKAEKVGNIYCSYLKSLKTGEL